MPVFFLIVLVLDWLIALAWLLQVLVWRHMLRRVPDLTQTNYGNPSLALPRLSVIVPARNEAAGIAATLHSLLAVEGVALEIVAVDDRSTDRTGAIMDALADGIAARGGVPGNTLQILHVATLPPGWLG